MLRNPAARARLEWDDEVRLPLCDGQAERRGWKLEAMSSSPSEVGGFKEIIFSLAGESVYRVMKFESGVHRVQRVPDTEASGRIPTSAATVAVPPEVEEVLRARLYDAKLQATQAKYAAQRKSQVSTGDRSAKIRTYNFPQARVTAHRIGFTAHNLPAVMEGAIDELAEALGAADAAERLAAAGAEHPAG